MSRHPFHLVVLLLLTLAVGIAGAQQKQITITVSSDKDHPTTTKPPFHGQRASVDVALLLDTSNSMDGLIGQAKSQLWTIVQQFAKAKREGKTPILRVALFEYGNTNLPAAEGYIRQVVPLGDDLDELSEALFALRTRGGDEYCGQVIDEALSRLDWSDEPGSYKAIFIAGNEPFTQGSVDYRDACRRAIQAGVVVNTIHCGNYQAGIEGKWKRGAELAEGEYFNIDQDRTEIHISAPQDDIIIRLNAELNRTYLWYGERSRRKRYEANQSTQDSNAAALAPQVMVQRAGAKASGAYRNVGRDLVDSFESDKAILDKVDTEMLPETMQQMSAQERKEHLEATAKQRQELREKIANLNREREAFVAVERQRLADENGGEPTLGEVMVKTVNKQLDDAGFEIE